MNKGLVTHMENRRGKAELRSEYIELRAKGYSYLDISKRLGVAKSTLSNWATELEVEIASARAMELDALQKEYFVLKESRIRLLGTLLKRINKEVLSRDLTTVPTEKLLELVLRYQAELKAEFVETRPFSEQEIVELKALA